MTTYTAKEAAELLGVSVQTIYRRLKQLDPKKEHQTQKDGKLHILEAGLELINTEQEPSQISISDTDNEVIEMLKNELAEKNKQIAELMKIASNAEALLLQKQQLELIEANSSYVNQELNDDKEDVKGAKQDKLPLFKRLLNIFKRDV